MIKRLYSELALILIIISFIALMCTEEPLNRATVSPNFIASLKSHNLDEYIGTKYDHHAPNPDDPDWEIYYYNKNDCKCIFGTEYKISVRNKNSENVIFFLMGGGSCVPGFESCQTEATLGQSEDYLSKNNPLSDWNVVFVAYCDGSLHMGDNDADYDHNGVVDHYHWGMKNMSAGVTLMKELYPNAKKILVAGASAGGYGTILGWAVVKMQYPDSQTYIFNDSGPGLWNPDFPFVFEMGKDIWGYWKFIPEQCDKCNQHLIYLYKYFLDNDPQLHIGMFSYYKDQTVSNSIFMNPDRFDDLLLSVTSEFQNNYPDRFKRFFINGEGHTTASATLDYQVDGVSIEKWLMQLTSNDPNWSEHLEFQLRGKANPPCIYPVNPLMQSQSGAFSLTFSDNKIYWIFNETLLKKPNDEGKLFISSCGALSDIPFTPCTDKFNFVKDVGGNLKEVIPLTAEEEQYNKTNPDKYRIAIWPKAGFVYNDNGYVFYNKALIRSYINLDIVTTGTGIATIKPGNIGVRLNPNIYSDDPTLLWKNSKVDWGNGVFLDKDGYVYIYGTYSDLVDGWQNWKCIIARVRPENIMDINAYSYYNGTDWTSNLNTASILITDASGVSPGYNAYINKYVLLYQGYFSNDIKLQIADHPWGPFNTETLIFTGEEQNSFFISNVSMNQSIGNDNGKTIFFSYNSSPKQGEPGIRFVSYEIY